MCGIVGVVGTSAVNQRIYDGLTVLQHRGQDAAGIATSGDGELCVRKGSGLVRDVFQQHHMLELKGNVGIGHVRYPTAGCDGIAEAQPFYVNAPYGICLAHNGNLTNAAELAEIIIREDRRHLNTTSDSEVLLNVFASELQRIGTPRITPADVFAALNAVYRRCRGGYAVVAMIVGHGILGFRDPNGIRPLVLGRRDTPRGPEWMLASESVALDSLSFQLVRDIAPGEAVFIDEKGRLHSHQCVATVRHTPCIFEYVYFARPDSKIDNISVYRARMRMGDRLAEKILRERPNHDIDVVIPIPDTSRTSALQLAQRLGLKYREGFTKNRYIGRTFIMPGQEQREKSVRRKLKCPSVWNSRGKNVLLVDRLHWCVVRHRHRSSSLHARPVHVRCTSLPQLRQCASLTSTASTCLRRESSLQRVAAMMRSRASSALTGSFTRISRISSRRASTRMRASRSSILPASPASTSRVM